MKYATNRASSARNKKSKLQAAAEQRIPELHAQEEQLREDLHNHLDGGFASAKLVQVQALCEVLHGYFEDRGQKLDPITLSTVVPEAIQVVQDLASQSQTLHELTVVQRELYYEQRIAAPYLYEE